MDSSTEAQLKIKREVDEFGEYLSDLHAWEKQARAQDAALAAQQTANR